MFALSQTLVKRLTAIHGWAAIVLGLLLYAVIATGTVAVFAVEIGRWSVGGVREAPPLEGPIDATVRQLAAQVDPAHRDDVGIWNGEADDLHVFFHTHEVNPETGLEEDFGTMFRVAAADGEVLERHDGFIWAEPAAWETSALRRFLVDLHVRLYLPDPWGTILTGILGLMMMAAVISGLLMHRHLMRDLFLAERPGGRLAAVRDRHALASSWSIPFAFLLAFTGSFFSLAGTVGLPLVASVAFGGDQVAMEAALFEAPVAEDPTPAPLTDLDGLVADSAARADAPATYVEIAGLGRADARVFVYHDPADGGMLYITNVYEGVNRGFLGRQAQLGTAPSAGGALYGLMYPLHFGHFAGPLSKAVWGALGVAMCFVILSGFRLWVRRRAGAALWQGFGRAVQVTGYGLPLGMVVSAYAFFLSRPAGDPFWWTPLGFLLGVGLAVAISLGVADEARLGARFQRILAAACLALPVLRIASGGMHWADALLYGQADVLSVDLFLLIAGGCLWWHARRAARPDSRPVLEPAE